MLTEEQIQRLAKNLSEEHKVDEEECEKHLRFIANFSEVFHVLLPEDNKELYKKTFEGEFFEYIIQRSFSVGKQLHNICRLCKANVAITKMRLLADKE